VDAELLIVGAGPGGLSAAWAARRRGLLAVVVDGAEQVGGLWAAVPPDLRCISPRRRDVLPDGTSPEGPGPFARADAVLRAWRRFAEACAFDVRLGTRVQRLETSGDFVAHTAAGTLRAPRCVIASGIYGAPFVPALPGAFDGPQHHSSRVPWAELTEPQRVGVIGSGASAHDAVERLLGRGHAVVVSAEHPPVRHRLQTEGPVAALSWRLSGLPTPLLPPSMRCQGGSKPAIPTIARAVARGAVQLVGPVVALEAGGFVTESGRSVAVDRLIWATGFGRDLDWVEGVTMRHGQPLHRGGMAADHRQLAYLGLDCLRTRRSSFLRGIVDDAVAVVAGLDR
jgi:putative flavoprotein involved in K+ transport